jgi:hypothetical protein
MKYSCVLERLRITFCMRRLLLKKNQVPNMQNTAFIRFCLAAFALYFSFSAMSIADSQPWVVDSVSGDVYVRQINQEGNNNSKAVIPGTVLWAPFEVITGRDGKARFQRGADRIEVSPNSAIELGADIEESAGALSRIKLMLGIALFNVDKMPKRGFEVETPFLVSVVKGTTFSVRVGARAAGVSLVEGRLLVLNGSRENGLMIDPGQTAYSDPNDKKVYVIDTDKLDSKYEQLLSRATVQGQGEDGGVADVTSWSLMTSTSAPLVRSAGSVPVDASPLVGGALETAGSLTGAVDSTAQSLTNTLSDTVLGGAVSGFDSGGSQLLGGGQGLIGGEPSVVEQLPLAIQLPLPLI